MTSAGSTRRDSSPRRTERDWSSRTIGRESSSRSTGGGSSRSNGREGSTTSTKTRYTRHSGLSVEFMPKHFNKRVEVEMRDRDQ
jgi:DNA (cytosine-5)-methyltransferase 1